MTEPMPPLGEDALRRGHPAGAERIRGAAANDVVVNRRARELDLYLGLLADAVRARGGRARQVRDVVGEVRGHCLQTGEDPVDVFGPPEQYASARFRGLSPLVVAGRLAAGVAGVVGMVTLITVLVPGGEARDAAMTVSDLVVVAIFTNVVVVGPWLVYGIERVLLPRWLSSRRAAGRVWMVRACVILGLAAAAMVATGVLDPTAGSRVVVAGPRWVFVGAGCLLVPLLFLSGPAARNVPGPPTNRRGVAGGALGAAPSRTRWQRLGDWLIGRAT